MLITVAGTFANYPSSGITEVWEFQLLETAS